MSAHTGRCFRALRRVRNRCRVQGETYFACQIRHKVPPVLRPFMAALGANHRRTNTNDMSLIVSRYMEHQAKVKVRRSQARGV